MGSNNSQWRREQRREDALERQVECDKLTPQQRLDVLDKNLGPGLGAAKERMRLAILLDPSLHDSKSTRKKRSKGKKGRKRDR